MDQREITRKIANTPLPKSGAQSDASPSAPSVGEKLREEVKRSVSRKNFKTIEDWKKEFDRHPEWRLRSTAAMQKDKESGAHAYYLAFQKFCRAKSNGNKAAYQILFESIFPKKYKDWSALTTIGDWKKEFDSHPEWVGRSTNAMQNDTESGANAFYRAFRKFCSSESKGDDAAYQKLLGSIFPKKQRDWSALTSIGEWMKEFDSHPEWAGRNTKAMQNDKESGANVFYRAFRKFCSTESKGDNAAYQKLLGSIFPKKQRDWSALTSIGEWMKEFDSHPEWAGRSTKAMENDKESGALAFCLAFRRFCHAESKGDKATYQKLFESIFPKKQRDWSALTTIKEWKKEFDSHPEWADRSTLDMAKDKESGALAFYLTFRRFCHAESKGDKSTYQKLFESIFPKRQRDWSALTTIEDWKKEFDSHPEWAGRSTKAMLKDKASGASAFYLAFQKFCSAESKGNKTIYQKLFESIFPKKHRDWSALTTIEDWKKEYDSHPEWAGRSTKAMEKDKESGAAAFYNAFRKCCRAESKGDKAAYQKLFESIFPKKQRDWSAFSTIEHWKEEFAKHPGWAGRSAQEMNEDSHSEASAFQNRFSKYCCKVAAGNAALLSHLKGLLFPLLRLPSTIVIFAHERLRLTEGEDQQNATAEIGRVNKIVGDTHDLKLPSGNAITLYSVQMKSGPVWACTKQEWKSFLAEHGLKEKSKHDNARSNTSLIDLL